MYLHRTKNNIDAFTVIKITPLARDQYMMIRKMYMEIESLENYGYCSWYSTADSMKLIIKIKCIHKNKNTQYNAPPTFIAPFYEPFTKINKKRIMIWPTPVGCQDQRKPRGNPKNMDSVISLDTTASP